MFKVNQDTYTKILSFFLLFLMSPWFIWANPGKFLLQFYLLLVLSIIISLVFKVKSIERNSLLIFFCYFLLIIWIIIPFREFDGIAPALIFILTPILMFLLDSGLKIKIYQSFSKIYVAINLIFILVWFLYLFKVPFPIVTLENTSKDIFGAYYYVYYGVVYINTQMYDLPVFSSIFRNHGIFKEPGHLGLYNCLFLICYYNSLSKRKFIIMIVSTILTFSAPSLFCLSLILAIKAVRSLKKILCAFFIVIFVMFIFNEHINVIYDSFIASKLNRGDGSIQSVLDARAYDLYVLPSLDFYHFIVGYGKDFFLEYDVIVSDYRNTIYKFGLIYVIMFYFPFLIMFIGFKKIKIISLFVFVSLIIFLHRSWMLESAQIFVFVFLLYCSFLGQRESHE
ncbi:hypothetical protein [Photobacterium ganghwense]|uniref:hypothetical protein n=1 Tax=Photobacterium ganghwense TaxID=320778 RepID=UPI0039EF5331